MTEETTTTETTNEETANEQVFYGDEDKQAETQTEDEKTQGQVESEEKTVQMPGDKTEDEKSEGSESKAEEGGEAESDEVKLEVGEDSLVDKQAVDDLKAFAKEHELKPEVAQKILDKQDQALRGLADSLETARVKEISEWREASENDTEIGGENLAKSVELSKSAIKQFASEGFVDLLNESGAGNHPEVVRFLSKIGKLIANDELIRSDAPGTVRQKSTEEVFYGKTN